MPGLKHEVRIYWSEDAGAFIAEVPELTGCMADGPAMFEALKNVEVIAQEWIETATAEGRPVPNAKGRLRCA